MRGKIVVSGLVLALTLTCGAFCQSVSLLENGDFSKHPSPAEMEKMPGFEVHTGAYTVNLEPGSYVIPGWHVTRATVKFDVFKGVNLNDFDLYGKGAIQQSVPTVPGKMYRLKVTCVRHTEGTPSQSMQVTFGDTVRNIVVDTRVEARDEQVMTTASSTSTLVEFRGTSVGNGPFVRGLFMTPFDAATEKSLQETTNLYSQMARLLGRNELDQVMMAVRPEFQEKEPDGTYLARDAWQQALQTLLQSHAQFTYRVSKATHMDSTHVEALVTERNTWDASSDSSSVIHDMVEETQRRDVWSQDPSNRYWLESAEVLSRKELVDGKPPSTP